MWVDITIHVGGYHEYIEWCSVHRDFQCKSEAFINLLSHMNHDIPPMYWTPLMYWTPPMYWTSPNVLNIFQCTEHPLMYSTHIMQGESFQIFTLKPNANQQVILSTLTFVTGLLQAYLFWKRTVLEFNPLIDFCPQVPVFINNMWINSK